ncbi:hypothetical protein EUGRSUZ_J02559 [Eucalyptus grandis]|uniref:Uncharacterized protein n=2 Tax=Eucalyptus grandis TaxID=71139 RepID=A0ACC3J966_EUCGR|nr:hypothetical protein EUGRSUZ_J02559 [Eucalyptus grandis]
MIEFLLTKSLEISYKLRIDQEPVPRVDTIKESYLDSLVQHLQIYIIYMVLPEIMFRQTALILLCRLASALDRHR